MHQEENVRKIFKPAREADQDLREGRKLVSHRRYVAFQMAEVAVSATDFR
jgi:hypothetical protein